VQAKKLFLMSLVLFSANAYSAQEAEPDKQNPTACEQQTAQEQPWAYLTPGLLLIIANPEIPHGRNPFGLAAANRPFYTYGSRGTSVSRIDEHGAIWVRSGRITFEAE
jgi:hypothetical protein